MTKRGQAVTDGAVAPIEPMKQAVAVATESGDVESLKQIASMADGLKAAARKRGLGIEQENKAAEVVLRAERGIGTILLSIPRAKTGPAKGTPKGSTSSGSPTSFEKAMADAGLDPKTAHKFQQLAQLPDEEFESLLATKREGTERIARVDFIRLAIELRGPSKADQKQAKAAQAFMKDVAEEPENLAFAAFRRASSALDVGQLADVELVELASIIKGLAAAYNDERGRRAA